jgi:hypothetical protein
MLALPSRLIALNTVATGRILLKVSASGSDGPLQEGLKQVSALS